MLSLLPFCRSLDSIHFGGKNSDDVLELSVGEELFELLMTDLDG